MTTKTSSSSSRFVKTLLFAGLIGIGKWGSVDPLLLHDNPWRGFSDDRAPVLFEVRAERIDNADCSALQAGLLKLAPVDAYAPEPPKVEEDFKSWTPWSENDCKGIEKCTESPCDVKLDVAEGAALASVSKEDRFGKYLEVVRNRVRRYTVDQRRREYEFPGDPVDPWPEFESLGLRSRAQRPKGVSFRIRKLDLGRGKFREIRQILDERHASIPGVETTVWIRDAYTDHYFDGWGEWRDVQCRPDHSALVTLGLLLEFDLLKKNDLVTLIARGSMKNAVDEYARIYLDQLASELVVNVISPKAR